MNITTYQLHILRHSLGLDDNGHGNQYRNYFCSGKDCDGFDDLLALCRMKLMRPLGHQGANEYFAVTDEGIKAALKDVVYPKLTRSQIRYQRFLNADLGISFGEFLKTYDRLKPTH